MLGNADLISLQELDEKIDTLSMELELGLDYLYFFILLYNTNQTLQPLV